GSGRPIVWVVDGVLVITTPEGLRNSSPTPVSHLVEDCALHALADRSNAATTLWRLHDEVNEERLRRDLSDGSWVASSDAQPWLVVHHPNRHLAYQVLREWHIPVARPIIDEPTDFYHPAAPLVRSLVSIFLLWFIALISLSR